MRTLEGTDQNTAGKICTRQTEAECQSPVLERLVSTTEKVKRFERSCGSKYHKYIQFWPVKVPSAG